MDGWTRARGVELTAESWPVVGCYLRRAQIFRTWGAIAGLVVPSVVRPVLGWPWQLAGVGADGASAAELGFVFLGYLAGAVAGSAIVIVVVAVALERLELRLVRRPQPFRSEPLLAADDAIRSRSADSLAGAGIAFLFFMCSGAAFQLALADEELMRQMVWAPGLIALLLALAACQDYGARAWRVQRARRAPPPTTPA